jgi:hypothetical protein
MRFAAAKTDLSIASSVFLIGKRGPKPINYS